jgi:hypothetical protein
MHRSGVPLLQCLQQQLQYVHLAALLRLQQGSSRMLLLPSSACWQL